MQNNHSIDLDAVRTQLVMAALPHVAFDGWSPAALAAGAADEGLDPTLPERLFNGGVADALAFLVRLADTRMVQDAAQADFTGMGERARLAAVIRLRLDRWQEHREAWRKAVGLLAGPRYLPLAAELSWGTADALWTAIGQRSHDISWYTRRASLSAIYAATFMVWLNDSSSDNQVTTAFLERRLDQMAQLAKVQSRAWTWLTDRVPGLAQPG